MLCLITPVLAANESLVDVSIVKTSKGDWILTYDTERPASRLAFIRNPDNSRIERWRPQTSGFEIISIENQEYLIKTDGADFTQVSVSLTPTYKHLSKDYAPFAPYSDGGVLIHTGRLFACIDRCSDDTNLWKVSLQVSDGEHIIVDGKIYTGATNWLDGNDGRNVYVGSQKVLETPSVIAVIDNGLPEKIKLSLDSDIPKLMRYFEQKLGKINGVKPSLFASYANVDGHSSQGGTLPNQIFMHWNVNNLHEKVKDNKFLNDAIWFFAHEVAHLYQRSSEGDIYGETHESWLHEGHADWLAALALLELYPETTQYVSDKIDRFRLHCAKGLSDFPLHDAASKGRFDLYYTCGLLIHQAIDLSLQVNSEMDIYSLWSKFRQQVENGEQKGSEAFLGLAEELISADLMHTINEVVGSQLTNPEDTLNQLMPEK